MENLVNNGTNPIFKPRLTDAQIAQLVRDKYQVVLGICAKSAAAEGKTWRGPGKPGVASNAQLWILGACLGHASTQETDAELEQAKDREVERLWDDLADVEFDDSDFLDRDMTLVENWLEFPAGTPREDIWHWFDERHSKGVYYLLYERKVWGDKA